MQIILSHLPDGVEESDIAQFVGGFGKVKGICYLEPRRCKNIECAVAMDEESYVILDVIAHRLNHYFWKGATIRAHVPLFQKHTVVH